jgi:hypothetical protein
MTFTVLLGGLPLSITEDGEDDYVYGGYTYEFSGWPARLERISNILTGAVLNQTIGIFSESALEWIDFSEGRRFILESTQLPHPEIDRLMAILNRANKAREFAGLPLLEWTVLEESDHEIVTYAGLQFYSDENGRLYTEGFQISSMTFGVDLGDGVNDVISPYREGSTHATIAIARKLNTLRKQRGLKMLPIAVDGEQVAPA